jgi:hypothetical protein
MCIVCLPLLDRLTGSDRWLDATRPPPRGRCHVTPVLEIRWPASNRPSWNR